MHKIYRHRPTEFHVVLIEPKFERGQWYYGDLERYLVDTSEKDLKERNFEMVLVDTVVNAGTPQEQKVQRPCVKLKVEGGSVILPYGHFAVFDKDGKFVEILDCREFEDRYEASPVQDF